MALTTAQIDLMYEEVLARHATTAEQQAFSALSLTESTGAIEADIATLPEATTLVDPLVRLYQGAFGRLPDTIDPNGNGFRHRRLSRASGSTPTRCAAALP